MIKVMNEVRELIGVFGVLVLVVFYVLGLKFSVGLVVVGRFVLVRYGNVLFCFVLVGELMIRN